MGGAPSSVDAYIASFEEPARSVLESLRRTILELIPGASETISYGIPTVTVDGKYVVYFAGWKHHVSLYPIPLVDVEMQETLARYRSGKGTLRFPLGEPMPETLIRGVVTLLADQRGG